MFDSHTFPGYFFTCIYTSTHIDKHTHTYIHIHIHEILYIYTVYILFSITCYTFSILYTHTYMWIHTYIHTHTFVFCLDSYLMLFYKPEQQITEFLTKYFHLVRRNLTLRPLLFSLFVSKLNEAGEHL